VNGDNKFSTIGRLFCTRRVVRCEAQVVVLIVLVAVMVVGNCHSIFVNFPSTTCNKIVYFFGLFCLLTILKACSSAKSQVQQEQKQLRLKYNNNKQQKHNADKENSQDYQFTYIIFFKRKHSSPETKNFYTKLKVKC
jgi:hypothetical protein